MFTYEFCVSFLTDSDIVSHGTPEGYRWQLPHRRKLFVNMYIFLHPNNTQNNTILQSFAMHRFYYHTLISNADPAMDMVASL